jgi:hypothetical protein
VGIVAAAELYELCTASTRPSYVVDCGFVPDAPNVSAAAVVPELTVVGFASIRPPLSRPATSAIHHVVGDAAVRVNPHDVSAATAVL